MACKQLYVLLPSRCQWDGADCDLSLLIVNNENMGKCFTFNGNSNNILNATKVGKCKLLIYAFCALTSASNLFEIITTHSITAVFIVLV